jgi:hypothetical protein
MTGGLGLVMLDGVRAVDPVPVKASGNIAKARSREELGDDPPHDGRFPGVRL